ncbi:hypothetical protein BDW67DRAFT_134673 [Aspergillus spinulosporus]
MNMSGWCMRYEIELGRVWRCIDWPEIRELRWQRCNGRTMRFNVVSSMESWGCRSCNQTHYNFTEDSTGKKESCASANQRVALVMAPGVPLPQGILECLTRPAAGRRPTGLGIPQFMLKCSQTRRLTDVEGWYPCSSSFTQDPHSAPCRGVLLIALADSCQGSQALSV